MYEEALRKKRENQVIRHHLLGYCDPRLNIFAGYQWLFARMRPSRMRTPI
jgi:hypothetical protein